MAQTPHIPSLVKALWEGSGVAKMEAAQVLGFLASDGIEEQTALLVDAGVLLPMVILLKDGSTDAKLVAASTLGFVADEQRSAQIVSAGALPPLFEMLREASEPTNMRSAQLLVSMQACCRC